MYNFTKCIMKVIVKILDFIRFLFMPHYWIMNYSYSPQYDYYLNKLLDDFDFELINKHNARLGPAKIWIANYPYACFTDDAFVGVRPKRRTILRARKKINKEMSCH